MRIKIDAKRACEYAKYILLLSVTVFYADLPHFSSINKD